VVVDSAGDECRRGVSLIAERLHVVKDSDFKRVSAATGLLLSDHTLRLSKLRLDVTNEILNISLIKY